jgi:hypothetical protein
MTIVAALIDAVTGRAISTAIWPAIPIASR